MINISETRVLKRLCESVCGKYSEVNWYYYHVRQPAPSIGLFTTSPTLGPRPGRFASVPRLSALIDFIYNPRTFHAFQLSGSVPLWCWPVTPSGIRLLLSTQDSGSCCLDRYGSSLSLSCIDGRYGDLYPMANPETMRLCLKSARPVFIPNNHVNMKTDNYRTQNLEVVRVLRRESNDTRVDLWYTVASTLGWLLLLFLIVLGCIMKFWLMVSFFSILPTTGAVVFALHGGSTRKLSGQHSSNFNRLVVVTQHINETNWQIFCGESSIVNSLLNVPLRQTPRIENEYLREALYFVLRLLILAQWAVVVGAAVIKTWDAHGITFWIIFCIISRIHIFSAERSAKTWLVKAAGLRFDRCWTTLGSRRALLNTIMALNPDTLQEDTSTWPETNSLCAEALLWIDPILTTGSSRTKWEEASRVAMVQARGTDRPLDLGSQDASTGAFEVVQSYEEEYWYL